MTPAAPSPAPSSPALRGIGFAVLAGACFVCVQAAAKAGTEAGYPAVQVVWARFTLHLAALALLMPHRLGALIRTGRPALQVLRGAFLVASTAFSFAALELLALPEMTVITFVAPLFTMALAVLWLGERVGARRWAAALVGFGAVAMAAGPDGLTANAGVLLALGMALFYALYQVATRALRHAAPAPTALFYAALAGAVASSAVAPFFWRSPDLAGWGLLALPALFGAVGQYVLIRAYETAPAGLVAPFMYVEFVWSVALGLAVFGFFPDGWTLAAAAIIIASGLYIRHRERKAPCSSD